MKIHKEGRLIIVAAGMALILLNLLFNYLVPKAFPLASLASLIFYAWVIHFFRHPRREIHLPDNNLIYAPADGKVVVIEEAEEPEYFKDKRLQVSIFMSPMNVHVNRNPISGTVNYLKYHPGRYLVAWHPKSSTENERTTVVIGNDDAEILLRQIAGAMAKRIKTYLQVGQEVEQGEEMGFIKFGSRVDVFLPLDAQLEVRIGEKVKGNKTVIARLKE